MSLATARPRPPRSRPTVPSVGIIGAGIAGIGVAIELAARGLRVDLHEKTDRVHGRASRVNEGKIHLGYTYANDPSLRTARRMIEGSWHFGPIIRDWLEQEPPEQARSAPFHFLVHRDSLLDPVAIDGAYRRIAALNREMAARPGRSYLRLDGARPPRRLSEREREERCGPAIVAAFETPEVALDTEVMGEALRRRVAADPRISLRLGSEVLAVEPRARSVHVTARQEGSVEQRRYEHVINASWDDLLHLDHGAGLPTPPGASWRWRHVLRVRAPHGGRGIGSSSIALGAFGDIVTYGGGDVFLSWYPVGRRGLVATRRPPAYWSKGPRHEDVADVRDGTIAALRALVPALDTIDGRALQQADVDAGVIYARGATDIDDPASGLHRRDAIGVRSLGTYHSFDTGKYTTAPLFARRLADAIGGDRRSPG